MVPRMRGNVGAVGFGDFLEQTMGEIEHEGGEGIGAGELAWIGGVGSGVE